MNALILGYGKTGKAVYDYIISTNNNLSSSSRPGVNDDVLIYDDALTNEEIDSMNSAESVTPIFFNKIDDKVLSAKISKGMARCVISPGIERDHDMVLKLKKHNIPIYSEIEFAYEMLRLKERKDAKILAVTGTNGKTTTTTLCKEAIDKAGLSEVTFTGGNIGVPFISGIRSFDDFILEVSSFQLEWIYDFKPNIAVLLNVKDDHLDRYENFDEYRLTKYKLFKNLRQSDVAILNYDDYNSRILKGIVGSRAILFGLNENNCDAYFKNDTIYLKFKDIIGFDVAIPLKDMKDKRRFIIYDMLAAACSLTLLGTPPDAIRSAFAEHRPLEHRLEYIGNIGDIGFYDDSKATNPSAVISAVETLHEDNNSDIVLILGGKDKGFDYTCLVQPVKNNIKACVLIGETKNAIYNVLKDYVELIMADGLEDAVNKSFLYLVSDNKRTNKGVVALSPASSSFDMFKDYNERGDVFKKCYASILARINASSAADFNRVKL